MPCAWELALGPGRLQFANTRASCASSLHNELSPLLDLQTETLCAKGAEATRSLQTRLSVQTGPVRSLRPTYTGCGPKSVHSSGQPPTRGPEDGETKTMTVARPQHVCVPLSGRRQHHPGRSQIDLSLTFAEAPADRWGRGGWLLTC